jgi:hypothetical protein
VNGESTISNPSASHSTASRTAAGSPDAGTPFSLTTISGSSRGACMPASDSDVEPRSAKRTVVSYMFAQTSVCSFSARQTALLAYPTLRPTVIRPRSRRARVSSASTA